jgi:hypothetical protein
VVEVGVGDGVEEVAVAVEVGVGDGADVGVFVTVEVAVDVRADGATAASDSDRYSNVTFSTGASSPDAPLHARSAMTTSPNV